MGEHQPYHHTSRRVKGAPGEYQGRTLMLLSELIASVGRVEPLSVGLDGFPELSQDPLHPVQHLISALLRELEPGENVVSLAHSNAYSSLTGANAHTRGDAVCALLTRLRWIVSQTYFCREHRCGVLLLTLDKLLMRKVVYRHDSLVESLYHLGALEHLCGHEFVWSTFLRSVEEHIGCAGLGAGELAGLSAVRDGELLKRRTMPERSAHLLRIEKMLAGCQELHVELGQAWSDMVHHDLEGMADARRAEWDALLTHLPSVSQKPSKRWQKKTSQLVQAVGEESVRGALLRWLPCFGRRASQDFQHVSRHDPISSVPSERNEDMLRGLVLTSAQLGGETLSAVVGDTAIASYHKIPNHGPRSARVGNACIWALGHMTELSCLGQLWRLKQKLSYATAERQIEVMMRACAERFELSMSDLEELSVPTFGLDARGCREQDVGDWRFELELTNSREVKKRWVRQSVNGQAQLFSLLQDEEVCLGVPRQVVREHPTRAAQLEAQPRELEKMLQAQSERLESMYWTGRQWPVSLWAERYLAHPLLSVLCKDLIWQVHGLPVGDISVMCVHNSEFMTSRGHRYTMDDFEQATITLWHPAQCDASEVNAWRAHIIAERITQPFKQAHREIYARGAINLPAHVLKQHQFVALCKAKGWKARLHGTWQEPAPPERKIPASNVRAQLWVSGVNASSLTTRAGALIYVVMEQLVFVDDSGQWCDAASLDAVVYSELMRDIELFVSVAGVRTTHADEVLMGALAAKGVHELPAQPKHGAAHVRAEVIQGWLAHVPWGMRCEVAQGVFWVACGEQRRVGVDLASGVMRDESGHLLDTGFEDVRCSDEPWWKDVTLPFEGDALLATIWRRAFTLAMRDPGRCVEAG